MASVATGRGSTAVALVAIILVSVLSPVLSVPLNATAGGRLSEDFHAVSCPQLEAIVQAEVFSALQGDITLAAGLIRIFFHDCFPQGCDASILLQGPTTEQAMGPNLTLQQQALILIEQIRQKVHAACGPVVSCADILALATRDAVVASGGESYGVRLGIFDSLVPASLQDVNNLPSPTTGQVPVLLNAFATRGFLHPAELVALSGAHSIGRAHCNSFIDRAQRQEDPFSSFLLAACAVNPAHVQILDVRTPDQLDNQYYVDLLAGQGVFTSDMALVRDFRTAPFVQLFANNQGAFLDSFSQVMANLMSFRPLGNFGEIRQFSCFRTNSGFITEAAADEGRAAAA
ncbi:hypothetical protein EJB05_05165, partial [Eragrostis curvula]